MSNWIIWRVSRRHPDRYTKTPKNVAPIFTNKFEGLKPFPCVTLPGFISVSKGFRYPTPCDTHLRRPIISYSLPSTHKRPHLYPLTGPILLAVSCTSFLSLISGWTKVAWGFNTVPLSTANSFLWPDLHQPYSDLTICQDMSSPRDLLHLFWNFTFFPSRICPPRRVFHRSK